MIALLTGMGNEKLPWREKKLSGSVSWLHPRAKSGVSLASRRT
jgi:hypothetical protein